MSHRETQRIVVIGLLAMGVLLGFSQGFHHGHRSSWMHDEDESGCHHHGHGGHGHWKPACSDACDEW